MEIRLFCLTFALVTSKSASQNLTVTTPCIQDNQTMTLKCETTDFSRSVSFYLELNDMGSCISGLCTTSITGYEQPIQSGTSTQMTITRYSDSRDGGNWTCSFGIARSNIYTVKLGNCVEEIKKKPCSDTVRMGMMVFNIFEAIVCAIALWCLGMEVGEILRSVLIGAATGRIISTVIETTFYIRFKDEYDCYLEIVAFFCAQWAGILISGLGDLFIKALNHKIYKKECTLEPALKEAKQKCSTYYCLLFFVAILPVTWVVLPIIFFCKIRKRNIDTTGIGHNPNNNTSTEMESTGNGNQ